MPYLPSTPFVSNFVLYIPSKSANSTFTIKGGEYNPKISGKGIGDYQGKIAGYYGKGNKAARRAGKKVKESEFPGIGRENYRSTTSGLLPSVGGDIRIKPGSKVGRMVDIDKSKEKSRKVREFIKQNQQRMANIKKGKGPIST